MRIVISSVLFILVLTSLFPREYEFSNHPIDVVIPCHKKDADVLEKSIEGIRSNGKNINRIFVISKEKLTQKAEYFSEDNFPFTKQQIVDYVLSGQGYSDEVEKLFCKKAGWVYQQLYQS